MWFPASPPEPRTALGLRGCSRGSWGRERLGARQGRAPPAVWTRVPRTCLRTCLRRSVSARLPCRVPRPDGRPPMPGEAGSPFALLRAAPSHTQGDPCTSHGCCDRYTRCPPRRFLLPAFEARLRWAAVRSGARGAARGPPSPAGGVQTAAPARAPAHSRPGASQRRSSRSSGSPISARHTRRSGWAAPSPPPRPPRSPGLLALQPVPGEPRLNALLPALSYSDVTAPGEPLNRNGRPKGASRFPKLSRGHPRETTRNVEPQSGDL